MTTCEFKKECDYGTDGMCPMEFEYPFEPKFCRHRKFAILVVNRTVEKAREQVYDLIKFDNFTKGCIDIERLEALKMEID